MKSFDDIMALVKAGFTAEQIVAMKETPAEPVNPAPAEPVNPAVDGMQDFITAVTEELKELRQTVTATAIFSSQLTPTPEKTPADVFGELLNPKNK